MKKIVFTMFLVLLMFGFISIDVFASDYYEFSAFSGPGAEYDVACYGNNIYYGSGSQVYRVSVSVADPSKKDEPRYLSNGNPNPNYQTRTFSTPVAITLTGAPYSLNYGGTGEMYVDQNYIYTIDSHDDICAFNKNTGQYVASASKVYNNGLPGTGWGYATLLSYGGNKWWIGNENRQVYSSTDGSNWNYEFTWNNMAGSHGDGMEYVNGKIFVSDMTSNYIAMWGYGDDPSTPNITETGWNEWKKFSYTELTGGNKYVEGLGFGALGHFWAGSGSYIYELGGGSIQTYTNTVPEPGTILFIASGLIGLAAYRKQQAN